MENIFLVIVPEHTALELGCSVEELKNMTEEAVKELVARNKNLKRADTDYKRQLN
jgi:Mg2+/citrate symporter